MGQVIGPAAAPCISGELLPRRLKSGPHGVKTRASFRAWRFIRSALHVSQNDTVHQTRFRSAYLKFGRTYWCVAKSARNTWSPATKNEARIPEENLANGPVHSQLTDSGAKNARACSISHREVYHTFSTIGDEFNLSRTDDHSNEMRHRMPPFSIHSFTDPVYDNSLPTSGSPDISPAPLAGGKNLQKIQQ